MMNPEVEGSDDSNIQITISRDHISHDQTHPPVATSLAVTPSDIQWYAFFGRWSKMQTIVKNDPNSVRIQVNRLGDTALHVAAGAGQTTFVEELVKIMRPEDMLIPNSNDMLPVHLAALSANRRIVQHLCFQQHLLDKMAFKDIKKLFFMTIRNNMFDVAMKLFQKYPLELAIARDEHNLTAMHMLVQKPWEVLSMESEDDNDTAPSTVTGMDLLEGINTEVVGKLKFEEVLELTTTPSVVLFDAIKTGNHDIVILTFFMSVAVKDPDGRNLMHLLFLYRRYEIIVTLTDDRKTLMREVDNEGNNVLHLAALLQLKFQSFSGLSADIQLQRELVWFKKAEEIAPRELRSIRNKKGKRPIEVFYDEHNELSKDIKKAAERIADSGMVVATLVATVAFAAAVTVPGDKNNVWFVVFIFSNAIALFASSASILTFLSNFTSSRFADSEFVISLHPSLSFGRALLIVSVAFMVMAFIAASFLIFDHTTKWVSYLVAPMGVFAVLSFFLFQSRFCDELLWSKYYRPKLE